MRWSMIALLLLALIVGCRNNSSEPGKIVVTSTKDLGKTGVSSSPPPVVPPAGK